MDRAAEIKTAWADKRIRERFNGDRAAFDAWVAKFYAQVREPESYCRLAVSYPLTGRKFGELDRIISAAVGKQSCDSGAGFGARDMGWRYSVDEWKEAEAAAERVRKAAPDATVEVEVRGR